MRFQVCDNAGDNERFAATAFESQIGNEVRATVQKKRVCNVTLVAAEVIEDGRAALLTYETDNATLAAFLRDGLLIHAGHGPSFKTIPAEPAGE